MFAGPLEGCVGGGGFFGYTMFVAILALGTTPTVQRTLTLGRLRVGGVCRAEAVHDFASGKAVNVARVAAALGERCRVLGLVGGGRGGFLRADLDAAGVPHDFLDVAPPTRLCTTVIDRDARTATELIEEPAEVAPAAGGQLLDKLRDHLPGVSHVVMAGSLVPGLAEDFYGRCVEAARGAGAACVLDARGPALLAALPAGPTVVKLNVEELAQTFARPMGSQSAVTAAMREIVAGGAAWCVVTRGAAGAVVGDGEAFWDVVPPRVEAVSAVGSGDAFAAGLALRLAAGEDVPAACAWAAACGAANALTPHAGHLDPADVARLAGQARVGRR